MVALCLGGGVFGISLGSHVTQSGFYDDGSQSVHASVVADKAYGRDTSGHIVGIYTAPEGKTVDDPDFKKKILDNLDKVVLVFFVVFLCFFVFFLFFVVL